MQNQTQGIIPLGFFPPFPPFPIAPAFPQTHTPFCEGSDNDIINVVTNSGNPSPVTVTQVTTQSYDVLPTDYFLCVDTATFAVTITLPTGILGTVYVVKDCTGDAATNPITIIGSGGQLVDAGNATINSPYGSVVVIFNGSHWSIV
jgi:hypothetical protein